MDETGDELPYWLVNVPPEQWPKECPDFLADCGGRNRAILETPDNEYHRLSWQDVQHIIRANQIDVFQRVPSELRMYLQFMHKIKAEWGSIMDFVLTQRLQWDDLTPSEIPSGNPFANPGDIKILYNDWPYGITKDIVHLVVWTKFEIPDDPATGEITEEAREQVDQFVNGVFCANVPSENVIWFKNWKTLKSIHTVEHFHIMMNKPDMEFIEWITNGDVALIDRVAKGESI